MEYDGMGYDGARLREAAAGALGKIKDANAIRPLISKLGDREEFVCQAIKKTLLKFGEPAVLPLIEALRKERDSSTRMDRERIRRFRAEMAIIGILGELKDPRAVVPLVEVFGHSTFSESNAASEALRKIGVTPPESCIPRLISASHTNNGGAGSSAESYAENALVMIGGAAVLPLITELKGGPHSRAAAEVLTRISPAPDESQIPGLISALPWLGREVDAFVQSQLEKIGEPAVIPLIDALRSGDAEVRGNAAKALARIKDSRAVLPIINLLGEDSSPSARAAAAMALGEFGDSRAVGPLIAALKDTGGVGHVDSYAAKSLAKLKDERAVLPLIEALHGEARAEAARALGELGDARAIRPLLNLIEECGTGCDFSQLRGTARAAIDKIQGR
jgi:HEAT repeat protein